MDINKLLNELTIEEKIALLAGTDFFYTNPIPKAGIPSLAMSDGSHGLRYQRDAGELGLAKSYPSTAFPTAVSLASSFNPNIAYKLGSAIAAEAKHYGVGLVLGPGVNIKRNPLCGRNFEYFSEDLILSRNMAIAEIKGLQDNNVGACVKHYALNNSENYRFMSDSICDIRAIREIYLRQFEGIIKEANPSCVMTSYNSINSNFGSNNKYLIKDTLINEWDYSGVVMTDWGAMHNRCDALKAGLDLEMPGDTEICRYQLKKGLDDGIISIDDINYSVKKILELVNKYYFEAQNNCNFEGNNALAGELACDCAVLLKNDNKYLPLNKNERILALGPMFKHMRYQGAGSSMIEPTKVTTPMDAFNLANAKYDYFDNIPDDLSIYDKIVLFIGLPDEYETEGRDRKNILLPSNQIDMINDLNSRGANYSAVVFAGSSVSLDPLKNAQSILYMGLPGQNGGTAVLKLLYGDVVPSGRLAETWVNKIEDVPYYNEYSNSEIEAYRESIFVGYRYYNSFDIPVQYPFGYGLSYSEFEYNNYNYELNNDNILIKLNVKNVGGYDSSDVIQIYVDSPNPDFKAKRELKAFSKVYLKQGEEKEVLLSIKLDDLKYFNCKENKFILENGIYKIFISKNVNDDIFSFSVDINGEISDSQYTDEINNIYNQLSSNYVTNSIFEQMSGIKIPKPVEKRPITMLSRVSNLKETLTGRLIYNIIMTLPKGARKKALKVKDPIERENRLKASEFLYDSLVSNSLNGMVMSSRGTLKYNQAEAIMHFANYKFIKAIKCLIKPIKVFKLPKEQK